jgi:hypothetical protein
LKIAWIFQFTHSLPEPDIGDCQAKNQPQANRAPDRRKALERCQEFLARSSFLGQVASRRGDCFLDDPHHNLSLHKKIHWFGQLPHPTNAM